MKVLHVGKYFHPYQGGMENFLADLAAEQASQGVEIAILAHHHRPFVRSRRERFDGAEIIRALSFGQLVYAPVSPSFGRHLHRLLRSFRPDILHIHMPNVSAFWTLLEKKTPPVIVHWHADVVPSRVEKKLALFYPFYSFFEKRLLEKTRAIIVTSNEYMKESQALSPFKSKCRVIPLGLSPSRLSRPTPGNVSALRTRYAAKPLVLSVGRFTYYKGFQFLIEAAESIPGAHFVIVGDGPLRKELDQSIRRLNLQDRVFLPGILPEARLHALMDLCDLFCLPSIERTEAFGLVLLEAMVFGKPLVTTDIRGSGVGWVNQHGITGLVVRAADSIELARAIEHLLAHPSKRRQMGAAASERFADLFQMPKVARQVLTLYENTVRCK